MLCVQANVGQRASCDASHSLADDCACRDACEYSDDGEMRVSSGMGGRQLYPVESSVR